MMKRFLYFFMALPAVLVMLFSCSQESLDDKAMVSVDGLVDNYEFEAIPDGSLSFTITSNVNWSIKMEGLDWVQVSPGRGLASSEPQTITLEALANGDSQSRSGVMTIVAGDFAKRVTLSQKPDSSEPELRFVDGVEDGVHYVDAYNIYGSSLKLYSNCDWTADAGEMDEWAVVGPLYGSKGRYATMSVTLLEVNTAGDRFGEITFSYGGKTKVLKICQREFVPDIQVLNEGVAVTSLEALSIGQTFALNVDANAEWTVTTSASWARISVEEGGYGMTEMALVVEPNETGTARTARLTYTNNGKTVSVNISQGGEYLKVSEEKLSIAKEGGELVLKVTSNEKWTAVSSQEWLTASTTSATGNSDIKLTVAPSADDNVRTATLTLTLDRKPAIQKVVTVTQSAVYVDLTIPVLFNSSQQQWNMTVNPDYASASNTGAVTGLGTGRVCSYTYPENEMVYAQIVTPNSYGPIFIMAKEGNITFKKVWTGDAIEFHIPVIKAEKGKTLCFDYGLMATADCAMYWNSEVSLDGGKTWASFKTNVDKTAPNGASSNSDLPGKSKEEKSYNATYALDETLEKTELIVRIICVDGSYTQGGESLNGPAGSGTMRFIGADHDHTADANQDGVVKGPKIYLK